LKDKVGIILGSGLSSFSDLLTESKVLYSDEESFHKMKILTGKISGREVVIFAGRRHLYEGYSKEKILEFIDIANDHGVKLLVISNAAGGLNSNFKVSDLMLITSHLNFLKKNFIVSPNQIRYDNDLSEKLLKIALSKKINLRKGTYCCLSGPNYETRSEITYLKKFGIDAVGMSTIPEVLYASEKGIKTIAISCITNLLSASGIEITDHSEVVEAGRSAFKNFTEIIISIIENSNSLIQKNNNVN